MFILVCVINGNDEKTITWMILDCSTEVVSKTVMKSKNQNGELMLCYLSKN